MKCYKSLYSSLTTDSVFRSYITRAFRQSPPSICAAIKIRFNTVHYALLHSRNTLFNRTDAHT